MHRHSAFWFLAPALSVITAFFFVPVLAAALLSLTDFDIYAIASRANLRLVGFDNYIRLLHDPLFWVALRNTAYMMAPFTLGSVSSVAAAAPFANMSLALRSCQ
jgi:multiple sugar transport system permease protein